MTRPRIVLASLTGLAVFGLLWEGLVRLFDVKPFILLAPSEIVAELGNAPARYTEAALVTARHAALGVIIALVVAVLLGAALAASRFAEQAAQPVLMIILVAPWVAYFSSIAIWLGAGDPPVVFLAAFVTTPAFVFAAVAGMRSADPAARELLASVDASRWEVLWRLRLPSALPAILAAARYTVGLALAAAYYGEGGNLSTAGLGAIGDRAAAAQFGPALWATVISTVVLGVVFLAVITIAERVLLHWHASQRDTALPRSVR
ncbi:MAG: ABC transporter permease subunit [Acidimicrobiia bacterium]|nr:ABC transporter permease subunit [Acidimicrobiia bacterium]